MVQAQVPPLRPCLLGPCLGPGLLGAGEARAEGDRIAKVFIARCRVCCMQRGRFLFCGEVPPSCLQEAVHVPHAARPGGVVVIVVVVVRLWHKVWWTVHPEPPAPTRGSHLRVSVVPSLQFFQYALEFVPSLRILGFLLLPLNFFVRESHV